MSESKRQPITPGTPRIGDLPVTEVYLCKLCGKPAMGPGLLLCPPHWLMGRKYEPEMAKRLLKEGKRARKRGL